MKLYNKLLAALCLTLIACLAIPAMLPVNVPGAGTALAATKIKLNKTKATVYNGSTLKLKVSGTKKKVTWSSSDNTVATVNAKGVVTPKKVGNVTITAKVSGKTLTCKVTVLSPLSATPTKVTLSKKGDKKKVTLTWQLSGSVSYSYGNASVIKCSLGKFKSKKATLTITAMGPGTDVIKLTNSKTKDVVAINVTVAGGGSTGSIVNKTEVSVGQGESVTVKVNWPYDTNKYMPYVQYDSTVSTSWGKWNGSGWPLTIKGEEAGETYVSIKKNANGPEVAKIKVTVK